MVQKKKAADKLPDSSVSNQGHTNIVQDMMMYQQQAQHYNYMQTLYITNIKRIHGLLLVEQSHSLNKGHFHQNCGGGFSVPAAFTEWGCKSDSSCSELDLALDAMMPSSSDTSLVHLLNIPSEEYGSDICENGAC